MLCGVAWMRQFLSRTRWSRTSFAGVRRDLWAAVDGGAKGEDWACSGAARWVGGVDGRSLSLGEFWLEGRISRLRDS